MLLTPSQVSVIISSGIVVLFTSALFLSGYVVQQKTLSKLRAAVSQQMAPRPSPKIYLPDRFKQSTTELADGTVVVVAVNEDGDSEKGSDDGIVVEVRPTIPDDVGRDGNAQKPLGGASSSSSVDDGPADEEEEGEHKKKNISAGDDAKEEEEKPVSRAERRRRIKAEIQRLSQGTEPVYYQRRLW